MVTLCRLCILQGTGAGFSSKPVLQGEKAVNRREADVGLSRGPTVSLGEYSATAASDKVNTVEPLK